MDGFRVRLNCVDHYQSAPTEFDPPLFRTFASSQLKNAPQVPVIRVFGATETGQKVCAHIHGAFPYLYIEYHGNLSPDTVSHYIQQLRASIDHALAVSYRRNVYDGKAVFVAHISLVKGVPFFGYHVGYRYFLKIYMLNPLNMTRFADLLHQGAIMNTVLQPFEAHAQYLQQWMGDYNLYGCNYIDCKSVKFRSPVPDYVDISNTKHKWHDSSINPEWISDPGQYPRQSHCSIEVDICVQDILNRMEIKLRDQHADFAERLVPLSSDEKLVHSLYGLWQDETRRRKLRMGLTDPSSSPFPPEVLISMSADPRNTGKGGWIHEEEFRRTIDKLVKDESSGKANNDLHFDEFLSRPPEEKAIKTAFESVTDLYPENLLQDGSAYAMDTHSSNVLGTADSVQVLVDEDSITRFDDEDLKFDSDEENAKELALTQKEGILRKANHGRASPKAPSDTIPDPLFTMPKTEVNGRDSTRFVDEVTEREQWRQERYAQPLKPETVVNTAEQGMHQLNGSDIAQVTEDQERGKSTSMSHTKVLKPSPDDFPSSQPLKKRKLSEHATSSTQYATEVQRVEPHVPNGDVDRPRSRHVRFEGMKEDSPRSDMPTSQEQSKSSGTPSSSQLSQGSIKASGGNSHSTYAFSVAKSPHSSQQQDEPKQLLKNQAPSPNGEIPNQTALHSKNGSSSGPVSPFSPSAEMSRRLVNVIENLKLDFNMLNQSAIHLFGQQPPSKDVVDSTLPQFGFPSVIYQDAYYSIDGDVPERARDYAGREFKLEGTSVPFLPDFDPSGSGPASYGMKQSWLIDKAKETVRYQRKQRRSRLRNWEMMDPPPSRSEVDTWMEARKEEIKVRDSGVLPQAKTKQDQQAKNGPILSQIDGPTQKNLHGFKFSQKQKSTSVKHETQYMSTMSLELHINTRSSFAPNPEEDEIACVFWCIKADVDEIESDGLIRGARSGIVALAEHESVARKIELEAEVNVDTETTELDLLNRVVDIVRDLDPDILTGYEVHNGSWGYMIERARVKYDFNLCDELSRMMSQSHGRFGKEADRWGFNHTSTIRVTGRHMINIWRAMQNELNLLQYTLENVAFHLLHKRVPHYDFRDLTDWFKSDRPRDLGKCLNYWLSRARLDLEILDSNGLIPRTSEQARLIGIDFYSVFSRGSQFKVESFMFRIAKPENFILVSPSRKQVGHQNALECLPLVMEPQSDFYSSPLLVLDFQSLYPSIMIAYNYCYSTCLGRIVGWRGQNKMGFADFKRQPRLLELVKDKINISPNGMMYVRPEMRKSLLAKMLGEILETRVMVKSGMKVDKDDKTLQQLLNNRQLALKLLANVTYGYTSASFSGRMPCAEIADSIVQTARETLEKAIALIHSVPEWGAEVVYGDTDSLFIYLKGRSRTEAFSIGNKIVKAITATNPKPIKLKFEKVYHPCILLAKKRYVGFKYESPEQEVPEFDAKGIETVRRDGTPAEQKIEETALKILFRTADLSQVKDYFLRQCTKIMRGKVSIQDFCFAREVRLGSYADKGPPPPGALISTRRMLADPRTEPQYGERVPYVVITGAPGARLIDRCVAPEDLLNDESSELDAEYYIAKNLIPPLERIFNLVGANVRQWYDEMPKVQRVRDIPGVHLNNTALAATKKTLENYMQSSHCVVCRAKLETSHNNGGDGTTVLPLCTACMADAPMSLYRLRSRRTAAQRKAAQLNTICRSCSGFPFGEDIKCDSKDCPVFYSRVRARAEEARVRRVVDSVGTALEEADMDW